MAGVAVFSCLISFGSVKIASGISTGFAAQLRDKVFSTVQSFSAADLDQFGTASLITRSTSDITNVQNFLTLLLRVGLLAPMMAIAGLIFSASTGGKVSFVLLFAIPVLLIVLTIIMILCISLFDTPAQQARPYQSFIFRNFRRCACHQSF